MTANKLPTDHFRFTRNKHRLELKQKLQADKEVSAFVVAPNSVLIRANLWPDSLNYFNYFTEIEDAFVRRRGKHLLLSPMDWALIESWKEMNVPLHIALRGIEKSFDSWESKPRKRSVKSLLYCQEEVEAQFAEWLESRLGASAADPQPAEERSSEEASPFPRAGRDRTPAARSRSAPTNRKEIT